MGSLIGALDSMDGIRWRTGRPDHDPAAEVALAAGLA